MTTTEPPAGTPIYGATFRQAFSRFWKGYVNFQGKASPSEFWWSYLITMAITYILLMVYMFGSLFAAFIPLFTSLTSMASQDPQTVAGGMMGGFAASMGLIVAFAAPMLLWSIAILLPTYAVMARRLRDAGFSPWLVLVSLIIPMVPIALCGFETKINGVALGATPGAYGSAAAQQPPAAHAPTQYPNPAPAGPMGYANATLRPPVANPAPAPAPIPASAPFGQPSAPSVDRQGTTPGV